MQSVLSVVSLLIGVYALHSGVESQSRIEEVDDFLRDYLPTNHEHLKQKYPLGYAVFYSFRGDPLVYAPSSQRCLSGFDIDWSSSRLVLSEREDDCADFTMPAVTYRPRDIRIGNAKTAIRLAEGYRFKVYDFGQVYIWAEIVKVDQQSIIAVIGAAPPS